MREWQAGTYFQQIYDFAEKHNITVIGGYHQTIAASGGWVQGGGHSILSPVYGLGVDRVVSDLFSCTLRLTGILWIRRLNSKLSRQMVTTE
jgi:hypothetical protein